MSKYRNIKTNGYDSKKEYAHSLELKQKERNKEIHNLCEQVKFPLYRLKKKLMKAFFNIDIKET